MFYLGLLLFITSIEANNGNIYWYDNAIGNSFNSYPPTSFRTCGDTPGPVGINTAYPISADAPVMVTVYNEMSDYAYRTFCFNGHISNITCPKSVPPTQMICPNGLLGYVCTVVGNDKFTYTLDQLTVFTYWLPSDNFITSVESLPHLCTGFSSHLP